MHMLWHSQFYLRILIPFILGILGVRFFSITFTWILGVLFFFLLLLLLFQIVPTFKKYKYRRVQGLLYLSVFVLFGSAVSQYNKLSHTLPQDLQENQYTKILATVSEHPIPIKKGHKYIVDVFALATPRNEHKISKGRILVYSNGLSSALQIGDTMVFLKQYVRPIEKAMHGFEFDYKAYMANQYVYHQTYIKQNGVAVLPLSNNALNIFRSAIEVRGHVQKRLEQIFEDKEILAISQALLIGYKASLSQELVGAFSASGTMHVLAVSGLHAGIVFMVLNFLFLPFANSLNKNRIKVLVIVPSLFFYAFVTGLSPSVVRAAIMLSLVLIASALNRRGNIYNTIFATAFYMLLFNPMFLFHVGFQLSFLAVLGIVYFQPKIKRIYQAPNKVMLYLWEIVCVSIAAQLATFPLTLYYFHQFPSYFILSNLLVLPAVFLAMVFLFPSILFLNVSYIGPFFKIVTSFILGFISKSVVFVEDLPGSTVADIFLHPFYIFVLFCIVFLFGYFVYSSKAKWIISILVLILISGIFNAYDSYSKIYRKYVFKHRSLGIVVVSGNKLNILSDSSNLNNLELYSPKIQAIGSYYGVSKENIEHVWVRDIHNIKGVYFR